MAMYGMTWHKMMSFFHLKELNMYSKDLNWLLVALVTRLCSSISVRIFYFPSCFNLILYFTYASVYNMT